MDSPKPLPMEEFVEHLDHSQFRHLTSPCETDCRKIAEFWCHESDLQHQWYQRLFYNRPHWNFLSRQGASSPYCISVYQDTSKCSVYYLVRSEQGYQHLCVPVSALPQQSWRRWFSRGWSRKALLAPIQQTAPIDSLYLCNHPSLPQTLVSLEEKLVSTEPFVNLLVLPPSTQTMQYYKMGVLYFGPKHCTLKDALAIPQDFLGETVELQGFKGYSGGLDTTGRTTGTHSVHAKLSRCEVMFHVAPFLPHNPRDPQSIERKRHIGNDILLIVYYDSQNPFDLTSITSRQIHVICFVRPTKGGYWVDFFVKTTVPNFQPAWPSPHFLSHNKYCREVFLEKCLNGVKAVYQVPIFRAKFKRTRQALLQELTEKYLQGRRCRVGSDISVSPLAR